MEESIFFIVAELWILFALPLTSDFYGMPEPDLLRKYLFFRKKLDQLASSGAKDWQIYLVVAVKVMRGCLLQSICPMTH
jgi:hypothetical protein